MRRWSNTVNRTDSGQVTLLVFIHIDPLRVRVRIFMGILKRTIYTTYAKTIAGNSNSE